MPMIQAKIVDPKFDGGPKLWELKLRIEPDEEMVVYGERLGDAVSRLATKLRKREYEAAQTSTLPWKGTA